MSTASLIRLACALVLGWLVANALLVLAWVLVTERTGRRRRHRRGSQAIVLDFTLARRRPRP